MRHFFQPSTRNCLALASVMSMVHCGSEGVGRGSAGSAGDRSAGGHGGTMTADASVVGGAGGLGGAGATAGSGGTGTGGGGAAGANVAGAAGVNAGGTAGANSGGSAGANAGGAGGRGGNSGASGSSGAGRDGGGSGGGAGSFAGSGGVAGAGGQMDASLGDGGVIWTATDYKSRKWARWPVPNPPSMGLAHPMSYTAAADTVTDNVTGLVWQKTTNTATTTWQAALDYCVSLGAGWSLPTRIELSSIVDNTRSSAKVDPAFTFGNAAGWTWASTPWVVNERKGSMGDAALSWFINFSQGDSNNSLSQTAASAYSRCVRIPTTQTLPAQHYAIANGEVVDNYTGLFWQQEHSGSTASLAWDQADSYCKSLALNGQTWRLPSLNEIASIVDDVPLGNVSPAVDHAAFPVTSPDLQYWSASPHAGGTAERWTLNFKDGFTAHRATSTLALARCVR